MTDMRRPTQDPVDAQPPGKPSGPPFRAVLRPHRSLSPRGFLILMGLLSGLSFATGLAFALVGAWPVFAFFGLDVALVYLAFRLSYRSGRAYELVELTTDVLTLTRVDPVGRRKSIEFNPYWVRVGLDEKPDGRTDLHVAFGHCLNDDEKRDFAATLQTALVAARYPDRRTT
jgi:uncharacterized membrane protein